MLKTFPARTKTVRKVSKRKTAAQRFQDLPDEERLKRIEADRSGSKRFSMMSRASGAAARRRRWSII
jgi:hypothetical protein